MFSFEDLICPENISNSMIIDEYLENNDYYVRADFIKSINITKIMDIYDYCGATVSNIINGLTITHVVYDTDYSEVDCVDGYVVHVYKIIHGNIITYIRRTGSCDSWGSNQVWNDELEEVKPIEVVVTKFKSVATGYVYGEIANV